MAGVVIIGTVLIILIAYWDWFLETAQTAY